MPGIDHSQQITAAAVERLKAHAGVAAIVGQRVYGAQPPAKPEWPFVRFGVVVAGPYEASGGWEGTEGTVAIHGFTKGAGSAGGIEACYALAAAIVAAMDEFDEAGGISVIVWQWTGTQVIRDTDEAGAYHAIVQFDLGTVA